MPDPKYPDTCPTCGTPVRVHSSDEGTSYYVTEPDDQRVAIRRLWEAATFQWGGDPDSTLAAELFDSSTALPGESIRGKELHRIGVELGFIEASND